MTGRPAPTGRRCSLARRLASLVTAGALCAGCGRSSGADEWIHLAAGFRPARDLAPEIRWSTGATSRLRASEDGRGLWIQASLERGAWTPAGLPGVWRAASPLPTKVHRPDGAPVRLASAERAFAYAGPATALDVADASRIAPGSFTAVANVVFLALAPGEEPPLRAELEIYLSRGAELDGRWRVELGRFTADGIPVLPGRPESVELDVAPARVLRFATVGRTAAASDVPVAFRVALNGKPLFETTRRLAPLASCEWHSVPLPEAGAGSARLEFSVEGPPAVTAFLSPRVGPRDVGTYAARPFEGRPDVVLFLADTFRADNMATYGGRDGLTPSLDRFADECVVFERAWSPSSWTLPAQASMLSGLAPHQHGATSRTKRISAEVVMLAERMRDAGYRTGAVTDGAFVSRTYGFDQGFEWFDEWWAALDGADGSLARAREFLDADDGRPVFLFVQTYRTHTPYRVSPETRQAHGARLGIAGTYEEAMARVTDARGGWQQGAVPSEGLAAAMRTLRAHYAGAAIDLDRGFAELLQELARRGLDRSGYLVFTSDHGEAFLEHDRSGHGVGVWEEFVRIPLLIRGPRLAPRRVAGAATLSDLPLTVARLAGVPPAKAWRGRVLTDADDDRAVFSFECRMIAGQTSIAVIDGDRKVIAESTPAGLRARAALAAYELDRDPGELRDLAGAPWTAELLERLRPAALELYRPVFAAEEARVQAEQARDLERLGY